MIESRWLCLELLKTRGWKPGDREDDVLDTGRRFLTWVREEGVSSAADIRRLAAATGDSDALAPLLVRARALRALLHRMFMHVGEDRLPETAELEALEGVLEETGQRLSLRADEAGGISWQWNDEPRETLPALPSEDIVAVMSDRIIGALARSAADLLSSGGLERVKVCDAHDCGWFFVDISRNKSRRWCDMAGCGNRAKARTYRERHG